MTVDYFLRQGLRLVAAGALYLSSFFLFINTVSAEGGQSVGRNPAPILAQPTTAPLLDVAQFRDRLVAVGTRGLILTSDDEGVTWEQRRCPTDVTLTALVYVGLGKGFAVGHEESLLKTDDDGATWNLVRDDPAGVPLLRIRFFDAQSGYAVGGRGVILRTSDGGKSWSRTTVTAVDGFDPHLFDIVRLDDGRLVLAGEGGLLFRSSGGGRLWHELRSPYTGSFFGLVKIGASGILAYGMLGHAYFSHDGGGFWDEVYTGTDESLFAAFKTADRIYLAGAAGVILSATKNDPRVFTLHNLPGRPIISGLLSTPHGGSAASDRGLRRLPMSFFAKQ